MNHDVLRDRYARLFELPHRLGKLQTVHAVCLDYRLRSDKHVPVELAANWRCFSIPGTGFVGWAFALFAHARKLRPEAVIASSDCLQVILGALLARLLGSRFFADLYDDYGAFGLARAPGMRYLYGRALARADGITVVSSTLGREVRRLYPQVPVAVLESTINAGVFVPQDRDTSLEQLGLANLSGRQFVGVSGGLDRNHGAATVFAAFATILRNNPNVAILVAGRLQPDCPLPEFEGVHYLGVLPHDKMPLFYNAVDVAVVALADSPFGYYAFPQKAYEVIACETPAAATDIGALGELFADCPGALYPVDDPAGLAVTIERQLQEPVRPRASVPTWDDQAAVLDEFLQCPAAFRQD